MTSWNDGPVSRGEGHSPFVGREVVEEVLDHYHSICCLVSDASRDVETHSLYHEAMSALRDLIALLWDMRVARMQKRAHDCDAHDSEFGCRICARAGTVTDCDGCGRLAICAVTKAWDEAMEYLYCSDCQALNKPERE